MTIKEVARLLAETLGVPIEPEITGECRIGDVRHCFPDISAARAVLGYQPRTQLRSRTCGTGQLAQGAGRRRPGGRGASGTGCSRAHVMSVSLIAAAEPQAGLDHRWRRFYRNQSGPPAFAGRAPSSDLRQSQPRRRGSKTCAGCVRVHGSRLQFHRGDVRNAAISARRSRISARSFTWRRRSR